MHECWRLNSVGRRNDGIKNYLFIYLFTIYERKKFDEKCKRY